MTIVLSLLAENHPDLTVCGNFTLGSTPPSTTHSFYRGPLGFTYFPSPELPIGIRQELAIGKFGRSARLQNHLQRIFRQFQKTTPSH
jgi:hypothetical protein